jgi:hypothetical protein
MTCYIKNIPAGLAVASGNRGIGFPFNTCELPLEEICFLAKENNGDAIVLTQENGEPILLRCIE